MKIKLRGGVSLAEQISFYRQIAVILRSGLPLLNLLSSAAKAAPWQQPGTGLGSGSGLLYSAGSYFGGCGGRKR